MRASVRHTDARRAAPCDDAGYVPSDCRRNIGSHWRRSSFATNDIQADRSSASPLEESLDRTVKGGSMTGHLQLRGFPPVSPSQPSGFPHNGIQRISVEISKQSRFFRTSCLIQCHTEKWARSSRLPAGSLTIRPLKRQYPAARGACSARRRAREESQIVRTNLVLHT
jgi:hypothetical protein